MQLPAARQSTRASLQCPRKKRAPVEGSCARPCAAGRCRSAALRFPDPSRRCRTLPPSLGLPGRGPPVGRALWTPRLSLRCALVARHTHTPNAPTSARSHAAAASSSTSSSRRVDAARSPAAGCPQLRDVRLARRPYRRAAHMLRRGVALRSPSLLALSEWQEKEVRRSHRARGRTTPPPLMPRPHDGTPGPPPTTSAAVTPLRRRATSCSRRSTRMARCWTTSRWSCVCTRPRSTSTTTRTTSGRS